MGGASASSTTLSQFGDERTLEVPGPVKQRSVLGALEALYPMLRGAIRDHVTEQCQPTPHSPKRWRRGVERLFIVEAIAGG
jgi:hypothetical protein